MKKLIKEYWCAALFVALMLSFVVFVLIYIPFHLEFISETKTSNPVNEYTLFYYCGALLSAFIVAFIAYSQLRKINKNLNAEYLIKIDERWRSSEIIKARTIIHHIYLDAISDLAKHNITDKSAIRERIGKEIKEMSESKGKVKVENFICLLNFLDFMETVGYLHTQDHLKRESLNELFGASIEFNYEIFEIYILHRRKKHGIEDFYDEFKKLYEAIQCDKCKNKE